MKKSSQVNSNVDDAIRWKLDRINDGQSPRVIDLFAGCGGLSLGTHLAGCTVVGAVEFDPAASRSHALNFHAEAGSDEMEFHAQSRDITHVGLGWD